VIRVATEADWATIPEIHRAAFGDEGDRVARLTRELRASEWYEPELSFVAEEGGALVGRVLQLHQGNGQAVDKDEHVRPPRVLTFDNRELVHRHPVVVLRVIEIEYAHQGSTD
jgi:hypothetical protein